MSVTLHRARTAHPCDRHLRTEDHQIEPGVLYVREVVFPRHEGNEEGDYPLVGRTCAACVDRLGGEWVRGKYQVPARLGADVEWRGQAGVIVDLRGGNVCVRIDRRVVHVHPTDLHYAAGSSSGGTT